MVVRATMLIQRCFRRRIMKKRLNKIKARIISQRTISEGIMSMRKRPAYPRKLLDLESSDSESNSSNQPMTFVAKAPEMMARLSFLKAGSISANTGAKKEISIDPIIEASINNDIMKILARKLSVEQVNVKDTKGNTALHYACLNNNLHIARTLVNLGADINARNSKNETPFSIAKASKNFQIIELLEVCGNNPVEQQVLRPMARSKTIKNKKLVLRKNLICNQKPHNVQAK